MNNYQPSLRSTNEQFSNFQQQAALWCRAFWQFSLFYGDYLASLHSRPNKK